MSELLNHQALKRLLDVIGGDEEDFEDLRQEFLNTSPELIETLKEGCAQGDLAAMRVASHSLKGNARDFGATSLAEVSAALETACKAGDGDAAAQLVDRVAAAEAEARAALEVLKVSDLV